LPGGSELSSALKWLQEHSSVATLALSFNLSNGLCPALESERARLSRASSTTARRIGKDALKELR